MQAELCRYLICVHLIKIRPRKGSIVDLRVPKIPSGTEKHIAHYPSCGVDAQK